MLERLRQAMPIEAGNKTELVHTAIRSQILSASWLPGRAIDKAGVARVLQVSIQPVTSALAMLEEEGFVEIRPQRGSFVAKLSRGRMIETAFVTAALVKACAIRLIDDAASASAREEAKRAASRLVAARVALDAGAFVEVFDEEIAFTLALGQSAGLASINEELEVATRYQSWAARVALTSPTFGEVVAEADVRASTDRGLQHLEALAAAILAGHRDDADTAVANMTAHSMAGFARLAEVYPEYCEA